MITLGRINGYTPLFLKFKKFIGGSKQRMEMAFAQLVDILGS